jgi:hypothetical protein
MYPPRSYIHHLTTHMKGLPSRKVAKAELLPLVLRIRVHACRCRCACVERALGACQVLADAPAACRRPNGGRVGADLEAEPCHVVSFGRRCLSRSSIRVARGPLCELLREPRLVLFEGVLVAATGVSFDIDLA